jgi:hypothetical protein
VAVTALLTDPSGLDRLALDTLRALAPLGLAALELPPDLVSAVGSGGRPQLQANAWAVGGRAECRLVLIRGQSTAILNTMIFPARPESLPVFVAEVLVTGGALRVAFVDLQTPGLAPGRRQPVADSLGRLAGRFSRLRCAEPPPAWATEFSTGAYGWVKSPGRECTAEVYAMYCDYLSYWSQLAAEPSSGDDAGPAGELAEFKKHHVEQAPVAGFLGKVFGAAWAGRFLHEFLYR